jgi:phosphatidate cytidylyltransferase
LAALRSEVGSAQAGKEQALAPTARGSTARLSEFAKRLIFSLVAAPLCVWIVWLGGPPLVVFLSITSALCAYEFYRLAIGAGSTPLWGHGVIFSALVPLFVHARFLGLWTPGVSLLMLAVLELLTVALWVRGSAGKPLEVVGITILGVFYTGGMLSFGYALRYQEFAVGAAAGTALVLFVLLLTWGTDIGGYVFGRAFGRRKLMPLVSPGKTVAGAIGGLALGVAISVAYALFVLPPLARMTMPVWGAVLFGVAVSAAGQVGDLVESMLKREAGVKDSSHLIPGHGGALDRVDSLLFTLPFGFVLLERLLIAAPR